MKEITEWYYNNIVKERGYIFENEFNNNKFKTPCARCVYGVRQEYPHEKILGPVYKCVAWEKPKKNWCDGFKKKIKSSESK